MRLFVALEIPAAVRENLAALIRELRPLAPQAKWVRAEKLHVTLKFIGEVPAQKAGAIRAALARLRGEGMLELRFRGLGFFPNEKRPRVFWAGIESGAGLAQLAAEIEASLAPLGIAPEERAFTPHLTLARFPTPGLPEELRAAVRENNSRDFGELRATEFRLVESRLKPAGAEYTSLATFPLASVEA
ncbi:MAG: RNA 2',3'-cyclic phosphodiesterase [Acidobacteria bacterium]|nr:MAG: RNA 2',3'-cyclic phosphodiesterase [Acidobacteriota bacterium]